eukprot:SAG22_NODE_80_length_21788_cov_9.742542_4_plen_175_part_00
MLGKAAQVAATAVDTAVKSDGVLSAVKSAVVDAVSGVPDVPKREGWTYSATGSVFAEPGFACYALFCPVCANEKNNVYLEGGDADSDIDMTAALMQCMCPCDAMITARDRTREKTNIQDWEGCCDGIVHSCIPTVFCWGCTKAQERREIQVWYGHAGADAPNHPGSPSMERGVQ